MRKIYIIVALALASSFTACTDSTFNGVEQEAPVYQVPESASKGELLIKFKPEVSDMLDQITARTRGVMTRSGIPTMDEVLNLVNAYSFERVFPVDNRHEARTREAGMHLWYVVRFDKNTDLKKVAEDLALVGEISAIQFNTEIERSYNPNIRPTVVGKNTRSTSTISDEYPFKDPRAFEQWALINRANIEGMESTMTAGCDVACEGAWEKGVVGDPSIIVAVFDEGVMYSHEDLAANMWVNPGESDMQSLKDNDGNGYVGDKYGYNFVDNCGVITYSDGFDTGHGTHVAGIIAATNNNEKGISSVAGGGKKTGDGVRIMSCQLMAGNKTATLLAEARAFKYAADNGAVIAQCSWGYNSGLANPVNGFTPGPTTEKIWASAAMIEKEAVDYFVHNAGSPNGVIEGGLAIFAAGNESAGMAGFPGAYDKCISVASVAADYTPSTFTNYGDFVDISAPGGDSYYHQKEQGKILSTIPSTEEFGKGDYGYMEGTSMACPYVCGVAALGLSYAYQQRRHFKVEEFRELLIKSTTPITYKNDTKLYCENWPLASHPSLMELTLYSGRVGGMVNTEKLLANIEGKGVAMVVPNVYVAPDKTVKLDFAKFFVDGETLTYTCNADNSSVATVAVSGTMLMVKGLKVGTSKAKVQVSNGKSQEFLITVRQNAGDNGWM